MVEMNWTSKQYETENTSEDLARIYQFISARGKVQEMERKLEEQKAKLKNASRR